MPAYKTKVVWKGDRMGHLYCSNGPEMDFCAPPALYGYPGFLTPEDAFVSALNTCYHMMFIWAAERYKIPLLSYECEAEGIVRDFIDKTSIFEKVILRPKIVVKGSRDMGQQARMRLENAIDKAIKSARKFSLVAESVKSEVIIEPQIIIEEYKGEKV